METQERRLRRRELYALVWEKAVQRVAVDLGVSDVAVAKACRKHQIPVPERGYWRRKDWGYKVKQPLLSALPNGSDPWITFHATTRSTDTTSPKVLSPEDEFEQRPENRIAVPDTLDHLARPVRHTGAVLRQQQPDDHGLLETRAKDCFRVQVAPASLDRAMRMLHALVGALATQDRPLADAGFSTVLGGFVAFWDRLLLRKRPGREPRLERLGLVTAVDQLGPLRRRIHRPVHLPGLVVVRPDLRVIAPVRAVREDVLRQCEDHRRVLRGPDDVLVRPRRSVGLGEPPTRGLDEPADLIGKGHGHDGFLPWRST